MARCAVACVCGVVRLWLALHLVRVCGALLCVSYCARVVVLGLCDMRSV